MRTFTAAAVFFLVPLCFFAIAAAGEPPKPPATQPAPTLTVQSAHGEGTTATLTLDGDTLHVDVISPKGIGGVRIALASGDWPKKVVVKLRYAPDRPFTRLEGPGAAFEQAGQKAAERGANMDTLRPAADGFELTLPPTELKVLYLHWVDMYRF